MHINYLMQMLTKDTIELEKENNRLKNELKNYMKAFNDLVNNRVSKRAMRILREKYKISIDKYNIEKALEILKNDIDVLNLAYELNKQKLENSSKIILYIRYKQTISPSLMEFIKKRLIAANVSDTDIIKTMEFIKIHNANINNSLDFRLPSHDLFFIINILNQGYEEIELPDHDNADKFQEVISSTINLIDNNNLTVIDKVLNLDKIYNEEDLNYIYSYILKHYQEEMLKLVDILKDKDFYFSLSILEDIKKDYKEIYQKYMYIRNKLDKKHENKKDNTDKLEELDELNVEETDSSLNLYYASNNDDPSKCYFIKDLMGLREESLPKILTLLQDFKNGKTTRIKVLKDLDKCIELKDDQIRIVLRPLGGGV